MSSIFSLTTKVPQYILEVEHPKTFALELVVYPVMQGIGMLEFEYGTSPYGCQTIISVIQLGT